MRQLLLRVSRGLERWDALTEHPAYRVAGVIIGLSIAAALLVVPSPEGMSVAAHRTGAVAVLMALWWVGRVLPMAVTALVPLVAFPVLGIGSIGDAAAPFAKPLIFLMLGGFVMGRAVEVVGLHERLVRGLLRPVFVRRSPRRVVFALMVATALLSGLVSNTATMLMLLPLATSLAGHALPDGRGHSAFVLALAYAASIGGVSTLIGTPPNLVLSGLTEVTFASWSLVGIPFVILALPAAWLVVTRIAVPLDARGGEVGEPAPGKAWNTAELGVLAVIGAALLAWFFHKPIPLGPIRIHGWSELLPAKWTHDALVAIAAAGLLMLLPRFSDGRWRPLLDWKETERAIPWSVLLLLGGGFSLAEGIKSSELTNWLASWTSGLGALSRPGALGGILPGSIETTIGGALAVLAICLLMTFVTELTSNTATTQIMLPVLASGAVLVGVDPLFWMIPATVSASCAFMMPVATAPNAIAVEGGGVSPADMALGGLVLNLICVALVTLVTVVVVPWLV